MTRRPGVRPARNTQEAIRGSSVPSDPTGRHVVTNTDGIKNGGAQIVHWCPSSGVEWSCPDCDMLFRRDEERKGSPWRAITD